MNLPASETPIPALVQAYRAGAAYAAEELLQRFAGYLHKWERLLLEGIWDPQDKELKQFLQMQGCADSPYSSRPHIEWRLKCYERQDVLQEIQVAFLDTALHCSSIRLHFRYTLHHRMEGLTKDPTTYGSYLRAPFPQEVEAPEAPDIDELWVQGVTCGPRFEALTVRERRILQLTCWCGYTIKQVATQLRISPSTVKRDSRQAKALLQKMP